VYAFDVEVAAGAAPPFYVSTQEGLVWGGRLAADGDARLAWSTPVDRDFASALALRGGRLAVAGANLRVFDVGP
jgi:hypothetical protein